MPDLNIPLTLLGVDTISLHPDGTEYLTNGPHSIAESKRVRIKYSTTYVATMANVNLWVKLALFNQGVINVSPSIVKSPINYSVTFPSVLTAGTYPMGMQIPVGSNINLLEKAKGYLEIVSTTHFNIVFDFYQTYDDLSYATPNFQDNHNKFLKDYSQAPLELTLSTTKNCYNSNLSKFCITARFEKDGQIHAPDPYPYTDNTNPAYGSTWLAGFYNHNHSGDPPYFSNPRFLFTRSAVTVTNFMVSVNTDVKFQIQCPTTPTKILMWIIRTDKFDNTVDMVSNYEANFEDIISTNANIGASGNKFTTPVQNITSLGAGDYEVGFSLKGTNLLSGAKYRLIAIVYDNVTGAGFVNSFISEEYTADGIPNYDGEGLEIMGSLDDYNRQFNGNDLECCIEERMRSKIRLSFPFNKWKNDIFNRLGLVVSNDIRRYLTSITFSIYDTAVDPIYGGVTQNIYDYRVANKINPLSSVYTEPDGMTLDFGSTWAEFTCSWRNRFENAIPAIGTLVNGVNSMPVQGTQYWGGKTLTIKWVFKFVYDNYTTPFSDEIACFQQIRVKDYTSGISIKEINEAGDDFIVREALPFCFKDTPCFAGVLNPTLADRKLIAAIRPKPGTILSIEEAEVWEGTQLEQLTTNKIINEEEDYASLFGETGAKFCIDGSKLLVNSEYVISAMAKKFVDTGYRVTEKQNPSVFEQRITEENNSKRTTNNI